MRKVEKKKKEKKKKSHQINKNFSIFNSTKTNQ